MNLSKLTQTDIGILKNLRSGGGGHLRFLNIPSLKFLQTLFKLSYEAIIWQNQLRKGFFTFPPSMKIRHIDNKSNPDEKIPTDG